MNTTIDRFRGRTVAVYHSCNTTVRKQIRDEGAERRIETKRRKFRHQSYVPDYQKLLISFDMSKATAKVPPKSPKRMTKSE